MNEKNMLYPHLRNIETKSQGSLRDLLKEHRHRYLIPRYLIPEFKASECSILRTGKCCMAHGRFLVQIC